MKYPLTAFPTLALPVAFYAVAAAFGGDGFRESIDANVLQFPMPAGVVWELSWGEVIVLAGLVALFIDLLKVTGSGTASIVNHILSALVFVVCLIFFLITPAFVTSPFFLLTFMCLLDLIAGFTITIIAARRDVTFDREQ
jgi:hypothetical protein